MVNRGKESVSDWRTWRNDCGHRGLILPNTLPLTVLIPTPRENALSTYRNRLAILFAVHLVLCP